MSAVKSKSLARTDVGAKSLKDQACHGVVLAPSDPGEVGTFGGGTTRSLRTQ